MEVKTVYIAFSDNGEHIRYWTTSPEDAARFAEREGVDVARFDAAKAPEHAESSAMRIALERISNWDEHPARLSIDRGSNGVRDFYRNIAQEALNKA